jgi:hypothetical protein
MISCPKFRDGETRRRARDEVSMLRLQVLVSTSGGEMSKAIVMDDGVDRI